MHKTAILFFCVSLSVFAADSALSQAHHYLLVSPGTEKWFMDEGNPMEQMRWFYPGDMIGEGHVRINEYLINGEVLLSVCTHHSINEWGDVFGLGACEDPMSPVLYIDAPLWIGKTWTYSIGEDNFRTEVIAEEKLTVPFGGPFSCFVLEKTRNGVLSGYTWVNDGLGHLRLQDWTGSAYVLTSKTVPAEDLSWGDVKTLYR